MTPDVDPLWGWFVCVRCARRWLAKADRPEPYVCPSCEAGHGEMPVDA